jgi:hypothetical protein
MTEIASARRRSYDPTKGETMNDMTLAQTPDHIAVGDEEFIANPELTAEENADDQLAHLLLTAWTTILKEDQEIL